MAVAEGHTGRPYRVQSFDFSKPQRWVTKEQKVEPGVMEEWRGPALVIGYFCEEGCRGHLELINDGECLRTRAFVAPTAGSPA
ncbi:hypothetical protein ABZ912_29780 [Nonomuraea angiospora]|uniref:hypothetical protein n=1 Tax=Nonomuraea angiospora TaxID=46172 RepID=UPI0033DEC54A